MTADLLAAIDQVVAGVDFGRPSARKTGRNPAFPYVPVIDRLHDGTRQAQILGLAYETREEALLVATSTIEARRRSMAEKLATPRFRALRESVGLPRELPTHLHTTACEGPQGCTALRESTP